MSELEPPPDELKHLFDAERAAPGAHAVARTGIRVKLAATVGKATLGHAVISSALGVTGKIVAITLAIGIAGGGAVAIVRHHAAAPAHVAVVQPPTPTPTAVPVPAPAPAPVAVAVPNEAILLRDAWAALSAHQPARALELAQSDEHAHPSGPLSEERDALQVVALAKLNRLAEARAAAAAFASHYPTSVHHDLVERAVRGEGVP